MFAVTLLRFIGADFIARKMRQRHCLATFQKSSLICEQDRKPVPTFLVGSDFVLGLKIGFDDRPIGEKIGSDLPILKSCNSRALV